MQNYSYKLNFLIVMFFLAASSEVALGMEEKDISSTTGSTTRRILPDEYEDFLKNKEPIEKLYTTLFQCPFPNDTKSNQITAIKHLRAAWWEIKDNLLGEVEVPFPAQSPQKKVESFLKSHTDMLLKIFNESREIQPYISFGNPDVNLGKIDDQAHKIVVTAEQLTNPNIKMDLGKLNNPYHTFILHVGDEPFVKDGCLILTQNDIPLFIREVRLVNPKDNINKIDSSFLNQFSSPRRTVNLSGLHNLKQ